MWRKLRAARRTKKPAKLWKSRESTSTELDIAQSTLVTPTTDIEPFSDGTEFGRSMEAVAGDSERQHVISAPVADWEYDKEQDCVVYPEPEQQDETEDRSQEQPANQATAEVNPDAVTAEDSGVVDTDEQSEEYTDFDQPVQIAEPGEYDMLDEDELRQDAYIRFLNGEDAPDDYTSGPSRVVLAVDGVKNCAALLMTMELSERVRKAVQAQRDYAFAEAVYAEEQMAKSQFELKLKSAIRRHSSRIEALQVGGQEGHAGELEELEKEVEKLQMLLAETTANLMGLKARLSTKANNLRLIQAKLTACLEEPFICAQLVEPPVEQEMPIVPILDVDEEYKKLCIATQESQGMELEMASAPPSLHSCNEDLKRVEMASEDEYRQDLINAFHSAQDQLQYAQQDFDSKDNQRDAELALYQDAVAQGLEASDESREAFDLRWYTVFQEITRVLVMAEEEFAASKAAVLESGLRIADDDAESGFGDDGSNGYAEEFEGRMVATTSVPQVEGWLGNVTDEASPEVDIEADVEVDEWDARNVEIWDSWSCVAYEPAWRRRIKKWRQSCGW
ncbi:hypothetical protein LTR17_003042 [Elasticomyces elasticus]|nr:hypothetical protein LTR17_003042 [Elasticomyces elasticus]